MTRRPAVLPTQVGASVHRDGVLVRDGARVLGARADAVIVVENSEHLRRLDAGLGAVESVEVLDALMCLPLGEPVPLADLGAAARESLWKAPRGSLEGGNDVVVRLVDAVCVVDLVVVRTAHWRSGLRCAAEFAPFARATVVLDGDVPRGAAWEAEVAGIGLRASDGDGVTLDLVLPAPFAPQYVKPIAWAFAERAYATWRRADSWSQGLGEGVRHR